MYDRNGFVYLMMSLNNQVVYVGVTNDLKRRVFEHKNKLFEGFSKQYNTVKLVYYEMFNAVPDAIQREKQIKGGSRAKKLQLIRSVNPEYRDLYHEI